MAEDKEREFIEQSLKEALERIRTELVAVNSIAHKACEFGPDTADASDEDQYVERLTDMGSVVDLMGVMCDTKIKLLADIARMLEAAADEGDEAHSHSQRIGHHAH
jgi:hypothetical protein